jgi:hypothetical protein
LVNPIREVKSGKEIQEGKARRPRAQEEGDEEGKASQEGKGKKTRAKARPGSDGSPTASSGRVDPRWHDRRSIDHSVGRNENGPKTVITMLQFCQQWPYAIIDILVRRFSTLQFVSSKRQGM